MDDDAVNAVDVYDVDATFGVVIPFWYGNICCADGYDDTVDADDVGDGATLGVVMELRLLSAHTPQGHRQRRRDPFTHTR